ncbi:tyrosine-type recombinase/integrase [Dactylosporangium sp. NPDC000244]|uniref:tyrosine-type recombinase/integrase n=1 Tax=Dactylosporangium sp. NPDC000244 TaxID=3154365 RepID=UPI00331D23C3
MLLTRLGISAEALLDGAAPRSIPTFGEYVGQIADAVPPGTRRAYLAYWRRVLEQWGGRRLDEPTASEIKQLAESARASAVVRSNSRGGRSAGEHMIAALRCIYSHAVADGLIPESANPAIRVPKPRRLASARHALTNEQLSQVCAVAGTTGDDSELDTLLLRLHIETACRRGGALALRPMDLDSEQCLVRLREKGETIRWQPVSPTLMHHLVRHRQRRGGEDRYEQLLRYRNGRPITRRRYDYIWARIGRHLAWVATQQISTHWLRHTTLTWVERHFGYATARTFAGHTGRGDAGSTATYVRADLHDVATATAALTGEPHPLANTSVLDSHSPRLPADESALLPWH